MNYDIGLNATPSLQKDITYGLSKQPLVVETLTKYFDEPITESLFMGGWRASLMVTVFTASNIST